jgi:phasin family protein
MEGILMAEQPESKTPEPESPKSPMPFADLSKTMAELHPGKLMEEFTQVFGEYQLPGINVDGLLERNRKNVEALGAANKRILDHAETVMTRQGEILHEILEEASVAFEALSKADTPQDLAAKQGELFRHIFLRTLENMRELADVGTKSSTEAFQAVNERVRENVDDIRGLLKQLEK